MLENVWYGDFRTALIWIQARASSDTTPEIRKQQLNTCRRTDILGRKHRLSHGLSRVTNDFLKISELNGHATEVEPSKVVSMGAKQEIVML